VGEAERVEKRVDVVHADAIDDDVVMELSETEIMRAATSARVSFVVPGVRAEEMPLPPTRSEDFRV